MKYISNQKCSKPSVSITKAATTSVHKYTISTQPPNKNHTPIPSSPPKNLKLTTNNKVSLTRYSIGPVTKQKSNPCVEYLGSMLVLMSRNFYFIVGVGLKYSSMYRRRPKGINTCTWVWN